MKNKEDRDKWERRNKRAESRESRNRRFVAQTRTT